MDHRLRWAMLAMGAWLAGSVLVSVVATQNFRTVDRLLDGSKSAAFNSAVGRIGQPAARDALRYLSSELNRLYFGLWSVAQVVLGVLVFWLISGGPASRARIVIAGMLAISHRRSRQSAAVSTSFPASRRLLRSAGSGSCTGFTRAWSWSSCYLAPSPLSGLAVLVVSGKGPV
jgi:hypothetical protein